MLIPSNYDPSTKLFIELKQRKPQVLALTFSTAFEICYNQK